MFSNLLPVQFKRVRGSTPVSENLHSGRARGLVNGSMKAGSSDGVPATTRVMLIGRKLTAVMESKNRTEASLRAVAGRLRESAEGQAAVTGDSAVERQGIREALHQVISAWRALCNQLMRVTIVSAPTACSPQWSVLPWPRRNTWLGK